MKDLKNETLLNLEAISENSISLETMESLNGGGIIDDTPLGTKSRVN